MRASESCGRSRLSRRSNGVGLRLAVLVLAVVGPATGLVAHLPTRTRWCHRPRARAPVFSSQVDEASASAAEIDEEWFPAGATQRRSNSVLVAVT